MQNGKKRIIARSGKLALTVFVLLGVSAYVFSGGISRATETSGKSMFTTFAENEIGQKNDSSSVHAVKIGADMGSTRLEGVAGEDATFQFKGKAPFHVTFDSKQFVGPMESCSWNFGDGETAQGTVTSHVFLSEGTYSVTLIAKEKTGEVQEKQLKVLVGTSVNKS